MKVFIVACALLSVVVAEQTILKECFEKDSIACVQETVFRSARAFFDQPSIDMFAGVSFAKTNTRAAKSLDIAQVEQAQTVEGREVALEDFLVNRAKNFFTERSLSFDVASAGRSIAGAIPEEFKEAARELVSEGRTKKKLLKKFAPILALLKLKLSGLALFAIAAVGIIAKKALFTSFIALAIAGASVLSSLLSKLFSLGSGLAKSGSGGLGGGLSGLSGLLGGGNNANANNGAYSNSNVEEIIAYNTGSYNGGNSGWNNNGWEQYAEHGSHSQPIGQAVAYSAHNPKSRR